jgi:hypothetical protein
LKNDDYNEIRIRNEDVTGPGPERNLIQNSFWNKPLKEAAENSFRAENDV